VSQTYMSWSRSPMLYPSLLYPHQADANRFHLASQSSTGSIFPKNLPVTTGASKFERTKHSHIKGDLSNLQVDMDMSSRLDVWGLSAESPFTSTLTEDDFLEMVLESPIFDSLFLLRSLMSFFVCLLFFFLFYLTTEDYLFGEHFLTIV
jgi:hypothetical protein